MSKFKIGDRVQVIDAIHSAGAYKALDVGVVADPDLYGLGEMLDVEFGPNHPVLWADGSGKARYVVRMENVTLVPEAADDILDGGE